MKYWWIMLRVWIWSWRNVQCTKPDVVGGGVTVRTNRGFFTYPTKREALLQAWSAR